MTVKIELKTYLVSCDTCPETAITAASFPTGARPEGWLMLKGVHDQGFLVTAKTFDLCPACVAARRRPEGWGEKWKPQPA